MSGLTQTHQSVPNARGRLVLVAQTAEDRGIQDALWLPETASGRIQRGFVVNAGPDVEDENMRPGVIVYFYRGSRLGDYQLVDDHDIVAWEE